MEAAQSSTPTPSPPPSPAAPQVPGRPTIRRYELAWRFLMIANLGLGAYMFLRGKHKDLGFKSGKQAPEPPPPPPPRGTENTPPLVVDVEPPTEPTPVAVVEPVKVLKPIPMDQQRELFKWILEEKRKVKPRDPEEKKRIDEDKAILKQFIHAESIPPL